MFSLYNKSEWYGSPFLPPIETFEKVIVIFFFLSYNSDVVSCSSEGKKSQNCTM